MKLRVSNTQTTKQKFSSTLRGWLPILQANLDSLSESLEPFVQENPFISIAHGSEREDKKFEKKSFFSRALEKTFATIKTVVPQKKEKISFDDIQELLIEADMEYEIIEKAMNGLPEEITRKQLRHRLIMLFEHAPKVDLSNLPKPFVRLIIGVNGAGKTTTIAKLANKTKKEGKSVLTIAIGCTGGQHRSVAFAHRLAQDLKNDWTVNETHRDKDRRKETVNRS